MPLERSEVIRAVIVRTCKEFKCEDGIIIRYDDNVAVIIDQEGNPTLAQPAPKQCFTPRCPVNCCASTHFGGESARPRFPEYFYGECSLNEHSPYYALKRTRTSTLFSTYLI
ncbi:hypothetical protein ZWY2020_001209 [Hordeum vulgare]|nr:hypothetical protein ZWY2020_001209 [Hordeum vulgare]